MDYPLWGRRKRTKQLVLACLIVALVTALLIALTMGKATGMAPPAGYSAGQLIFDDQFSGTSLNSAHWNTVMGGQGGPTWNPDGLPAGDSAAGTHSHQTYFSPSQVTVNHGLTLTMVPDTKYSSLGYGYRSGVVTTYDKFTLRSGYVQIKAKMSDASQGGWPAIWFIDPSSGGGSQEIDLQEGGFTPNGCRAAESHSGEQHLRVDVPHTIRQSIGLQLRHTQAHERWVQHLRDAVHPWPVDQDVLQWQAGRFVDSEHQHHSL